MDNDGNATRGDIPADRDVRDIVKLFFSCQAVNDTKQEGKIANHSKLVVVDDCVCYIGSDNAYPSFLPEFGIWIDDAPSIEAFVEKYWNPLVDFKAG